jgi:post-segregation antitoxin (ccd killing protein)
LQVATPGDASLTSREPVVQALLSGPKGALGSGSIENQVARLSDARLPIRQRQALAAEIGRVQGNRRLQRVVASLISAAKVVSPAFRRSNGNQTLQRYPVDLPANASCTEVLDWMNTSNPYVPNWAQTAVSFDWRGSFLISSSAPNFRLRVGNPRMIMTGPTVDMPQYQPRDPAMRLAWQAMYRSLCTHEGRHEGIARAWRGTLLQRLRALNLEVTASSRDEVNAMAQELIQAEWDQWLAEHQEAQDAIDPYTGTLNCPETPVTS